MKTATTSRMKLKTDSGADPEFVQFACNDGRLGWFLFGVLALRLSIAVSVPDERRQASDARAVNTTHVGFGMPFWLVVGGVRVDTKC